MTTENRETGKRFPIQTSRRYAGAAHPVSIPWSVAETAYSVYAAKYGTSQSLAGLAERGGFGAGEMDEFLPDWRAIADAEDGRVWPYKSALAALLGQWDSIHELRDCGCGGRWPLCAVCSARRLLTHKEEPETLAVYNGGELGAIIRELMGLLASFAPHVSCQCIIGQNGREGDECVLCRARAILRMRRLPGPGIDANRRPL